MSMPRHGGTRDKNQKGLLDLANSIPGCKAVDLGAVGDGIPDALIGWFGHNYLAEIKRADCPPSDSKLNPTQVEWHDTWPGQVAVIRTAADLYKLLGVEEWT